MSNPIKTKTERDGAVERIILAQPKGNILDSTMLAALRETVVSLAGRPELKLVVFEGEDKHFSFGASVEEHMPELVHDMLTNFHQLFRDIEAIGVPTAAVVRGQCLGGGFELATYCGWVCADSTAHLGVPEVRLGVFPPIAALCLPWRMSATRAVHFVLSGRVVKGGEAHELGLVDFYTDDPEAALAQMFDRDMANNSAVAVRYSWRASRLPMVRALKEDLPVLESLYLEELMSHQDPVEGLVAFQERRKPRWKNC